MPIRRGRLYDVKTWGRHSLLSSQLEAVQAQVLDSPTYGVACPVVCDGVVRLVGRDPDRDAVERARARLELECWSDDEQGIDVDLLIDQLASRSAAVT